MKKLMTLLLVGSLFISCANAQNKASETGVKSESAVKSEVKAGTVKMTKADFLKKIADYEKNPTEWKYLGDKPAIVDFYANWCGPCRSIAPVLEELAKEYDGKIVIYKVNTDKERELSGALGIQSLPSLLFIPMDGKPQMATGALPKETFKKIIDDFLLKK